MSRIVPRQPNLFNILRAVGSILNGSTGIVVDRGQIQRIKRGTCRNPGLTGRTAESRFRDICSGKHK